MHCPNCSGQLLKIEIQFQGFVKIFFQNAADYRITEPISIDSQWHDQSACQCEACGWNGTVSDALGRCQGPWKNANEGGT